MDKPEFNVLTEISVKVGKLETGQEATAKSIGDMATSVNRLVDKLDQSDDVAREAGQRARSAHHRLDEVKMDLEKAISDIKDDIKWIWRTVFASVITGAIGGAIALIWKGIGK